jgi:hypothetical protein
MPRTSWLRRRIGGLIRRVGILQGQEKALLLLGRLHAGRVRTMGAVGALREVEFSVFSQFGDDGIVQWLVHHAGCATRRFIEFGVEDYRESTTRFLLMNDDWSGLVLDGSAGNVAAIRGSEYFWRHDLEARAVFVDKDNVDALLGGWAAGRPVDLLHIDVDGNDWWLWQAVTSIAPTIVIVEYNSVFGPERAITVPYDPAFVRWQKHPSGLYFGASLAAFVHLAREKGYALLGSNSAGNNAYFVRREVLGGPLREVSVAEGYVRSRFRESRDPDGRPTFLAGDARLAAVRGLPVHDVTSGKDTVL